MRQIILDTETTGLEVKQGHRVIEIGGIEMIDRRLTDKHFHVYINPGREVEAEALKVHGISNEFLADKPLFGDIAAQFLAFVEGAELVIHNAPFDLGFLNAELKAHLTGFKQLQKNCAVVDTLVLARQLHPGQRNSLDALSKRYHVDTIDRALHGALLDAKILAQVYLAMTGGQVALFEETQTEHTAAEVFAHRAERRQDLHLPRLLPTDEELAAHQAFMQGLKSRMPDALWDTHDEA